MLETLTHTSMNTETGAETGKIGDSIRQLEGMREEQVSRYENRHLRKPRTRAQKQE